MFSSGGFDKEFPPSSDGGMLHSKEVTVCIAIVLSLVSLATVLDNLFIIFAFYSDVKLRQKPSNRLLVSLAFSGLLTGAVSMPFEIEWMHRDIWKHGETTCKFVLLVDFVACFVTVVCVILVSVDRYIMVTKGMQYAVIQTGKRVVIYCYITWLLGLLLYTPSLLWSTVTGQRNINYDVTCKNEEFHSLPYNICKFVVGYILPGFLIAYLNVAVYCHVRKRLNGSFKIRNNQNMVFTLPVTITPSDTIVDVCEATQTEVGATVTGSRSRHGETFEKRQAIGGPKHFKAGRHLLAVVVFFVGCWTPFYVYTILDIVCPKSYNEHAWSFVNWLVWFHSTINPIVYIFTVPQYRDAFKRIFGCQRLNQVRNGR
ncbi:5-hydroxytryptamine receptor 1B-like [Glandiceps talaboti]